MLLYESWEESRKVRMLKEMGDYLLENNPSSYYTTWQKHGAPLQRTAELTVAKRQEISRSEEKFNNAIFAFVCSVICDLSFLEESE